MAKKKRKNPNLISKRDIYQEVSTECRVSLGKMYSIGNAIFEAISKHMARGKEQVRISNFGVFILMERKARVRKHTQIARRADGSVWEIPTDQKRTHYVKFRQGKFLKAIVQQKEGKEKDHANTENTKIASADQQADAAQLQAHAGTPVPSAVEAERAD